MTTNAHAMVFASFAADALALGAHWIYDVHLIDQNLGRMSDFRKPQPPTYHPTKERGDFTHYGDQTLVLLRFLAERSGFDERDFGRAWREFGQMCEVEAAFPAAIHLIAKYENRLEEGLIENVMAGGDSAGRGLAVGMLLGARAGMQAIPRRWLDSLTARATIERLLTRIDPARSREPDGRGPSA